LDVDPIKILSMVFVKKYVVSKSLVKRLSFNLVIKVNCKESFLFSRQIYKGLVVLRFSSMLFFLLSRFENFKGLNEAVKALFFISLLNVSRSFIFRITSDVSGINCEAEVMFCCFV
ncbi:MAG: hypothetical protein KJN82_03640, partial [Bacteroidia bacterium]|nr:hypothetical protein [Bacteroidia bacterium]